MSTEELLVDVERINTEGGLDENDIVGSSDIEALYPNLDIDFTIDKVCEVFKDSTVTIEGIDYAELGLYLSLNKTDDELREEELHNVCPIQSRDRGPRPTMTGCGAENNRDRRHAPIRVGRNNEKKDGS